MKVLKIGLGKLRKYGFGRRLIRSVIGVNGKQINEPLLIVDYILKETNYASIPEFDFCFLQGKYQGKFI